MASSSDVVKKITRFKLQLTDTAESATVLKILQKLKDLDITLDILAETGIGKTVNSLRRHEQAGAFARSLVRCWKRLVPKRSTSRTEHGDVSESLSVRDELDDQNCPNNGGLMEDLNHNCLMSNGKNQNFSDESLFKTGNRKVDSEKQCEGQARHEYQNENEEKSQEQENPTISKREDTYQESGSDSREKFKSNSESGRFGSEKESNKKLKTSQALSKEGKISSSFESGEKYSNTSNLANVKDDGPSEILRSLEAQNKKRKKTGKLKHTTLKYEQESGNKGQSRYKKAKIKHKESNHDPGEPSMSFESCLNYDLNALKRKDRSGVKKPPKKIKTAVKEEATKGPGMTAFKSHVMSLNVMSPKQMKESVMDLMDIPLPALLLEYEKPSSEYFERKVEKESDFCDVSEESAVFTGQRLNKKMQVYSGAKTVFLPTMMSLHQQCIRTLQNNINLLYETGGVPFEILEPVLERCTPEQLLRIEECNPIYVGVTDHLWGKHCQRDFKDSKLQEYESWKEMYIRLSEERERKLQRLTKSIVSAHSCKPKGRQVKMAFIHTVAKPPRDVRIQQEIHGTAVQQPPHQLRCSVKVQDHRPKPSCNEPSRCSSTSSVASATQDARKRTRVAPMMAKSLKAFKKQLGRR